MKIVIFSYPLALDAPVRGPHWNIVIPFGTETRMVWLLDGKKCFMIRLAVSMEYWHVMDGRTDVQTDGHLATA